MDHLPIERLPFPQHLQLQRQEAQMVAPMAVDAAGMPLHFQQAGGGPRATNVNRY